MGLRFRTYECIRSRIFLLPRAIVSEEWAADTVKLQSIVEIRFHNCDGACRCACRVSGSLRFACYCEIQYRPKRLHGGRSLLAEKV